ncbi:MAG: hypothetical protein QOD51_1094, partial [Candidatus Eremiobacteraeota bacterium]|nr:hypothetical protein [Candidatus Eremiobacteraeota bacterium]
MHEEQITTVRGVREVLALYSDLHDAELSNVSLDLKASTASLIFCAEQYPTEQVYRVALTIQRLLFFEVFTPSRTKPGF